MDDTVTNRVPACVQSVSIKLLCVQLPYFQLLTNWLKEQPELTSLVDTDNIGVAGHSRGAKLAALHFASGKLTGLPVCTVAYRGYASHADTHCPKYMLTSMLSQPW